MSWLGSIFTGDEELGKKNDDRRPNKNNALSSAWSARKIPPLPRRRRIFYTLIACITLYLFFKNIPPPVEYGSRIPHNRPVYGRSPKQDLIPETTQEAPPHAEKPSDAETHYFEGPIKFRKLAESLRAIARYQGYRDTNDNVLFAASNLKSASEMISFACDMAAWERNTVHIALMGRDDLPVREIQLLNNVDSECKIHWHGNSSTSLV